MSIDYGKELLLSGIQEAKAGNKEAARRYFERAAHSSKDPDVIAEAWFGVSQTTASGVEKREALENCLTHSPGHTRARQALALLNEIVAPDHLSSAPKDSQTAKGAQATCPQCGKRMSFTPDGKSLVCEHCARKENLAVQPGTAHEKDLVIAAAITHGHSQPLNQPVFRCEGCGCQFILSPNQSLSVCVYCGSARVVSQAAGQQLLAPTGILPHLFDQNQATQLLMQWVKKCQIRPEKKVELPRGVYLPLWTFNLGGLIDYISERTEQSYSGPTTRQIRSIRLKGCYPVHADGILIPALRKSSAVFLKLTSSFALESAKPYDPRYLTNWPAGIYDTPLAEASLNARAQVMSRYKRELPNALAMKVLSTSSAQMTIESFRLDLLPVWITEISLSGQKYLVLINGENGMIASDLPEKSGVMKFLSDLLD